MDNLRAFCAMSVMLACAWWSFMFLPPREMLGSIVLFLLCAAAGYFMGRADSNYERDNK